MSSVWADHRTSFPADTRIILSAGILVRVKHKIYENGSSFPVRPETVFMITFANDISGRDAAELFECTVPCQYFAIFVDDKCGIRKETDYVF